MSDTVKAVAPSELLAVAERLARVVDSSDYGGAEEDLKLVADYARAALSTKSPQEAPSALERFNVLWEFEYGHDPIERLRFFCSLAMNGQDWLDVEPFFDALATPAVAPGVDVDLDAPVWKHEPPTLSAVIAELRRTLQPYFPDT